MPEDPAGPPRGRPGGPGTLPKKGRRDAWKAAAAAHPGERITPWFMDEARVGQKGRPCHRRWLQGRRPPGRRDRRFTWASLFAAVEPATMRLFLAAFAAGLPGDMHGVRVLDRAGRHGARARTVPPNVTPVPPPACSPELDPVERVRLYPRERFLALRVFADHRAIVDARGEAWSRLAAEPDRLRSLGNQPWIRNVSS